MKIQLIKDVKFDQNAYLYYKNGRGFIIDPGYQYKKIKKFLVNNNIELSKILLTHFHFDHCFSAQKLAEEYNIKIMIHKNDFKLAQKNNLGSMMGFANVTIEKKYLEKLENNLKILNKKIKVLLAPGHSPGSVLYLIDNDLYTGDVLFLDSIGRTDFVSGSETQMRDSLKKISSLDTQLVVHPGHGDSATLESILKFNKTFKSFL